MARFLDEAQIAALVDKNLLNYYREMKRYRGTGATGAAFLWCYWEARRELTRRGLRDYAGDVIPPKKEPELSELEQLAAVWEDIKPPTPSTRRHDQRRRRRARK